MDYLIRGLARQGKVRVLACQTTNMVQVARDRHQSYATATAALGRLMSVGAMMGVMLKGEERITLQVQGDGPVGTMMVDANSRGEVRGFVANPQVYLVYNDSSKLAVGQAVGQGTLTVIKDLGLKEPYTGQVQLVNGEIAEDFAYYFALSEQTPSVVSLGVLVNPDESVLASGGILIQLMPDANEEDILFVEDAIKTLRPISGLIAENQSPEMIVDSLFDDFECLETKPLVYHCPCTKERLVDAIRLIGKEEIQSMIEEDHGCQANCQFCGKAYVFTEDELKEIEEGL